MYHDVLASWQRVWREGFAPNLTTAGLEALRQGLAQDDPALVQAATIDPPPLLPMTELPAEAACAVAYAGWQGDCLTTVAEVEEFFARTCYAAEQLLGEAGACRWFMNWHDETPRAEMRRQLLEEVSQVLAERRCKIRPPASRTPGECFVRASRRLPPGYDDDQ
jgi:hypothetical protein